MNAYKILIVEDELIIAGDIKKTLKRLGYQVSGVVSSGEEALKSAAAIRPDLVLMDIKLKGAMDGIEIARLLREQFRIPVVYLTAHAHKETIKQAKLTEPFGYIIKPFEERSLSATIEMALYKSQMEIKREQLLVEKEESHARLVKSEEILKKMSEKLLHSNQELEQFTTIASHDLKSPLGNILSYAEALEEEFPALGAEEKNYLQVIRKSAGRMMELINDLLEFSKLSHASKNFQETNLKDLIAEILENLESKIQEKNALVEVGTLPKVKADPLQIKHIFQNLIENALKYSSDQQRPSIKIDGLLVKGFVEVHVRDNGIGFDEKNAEEIFLPFKRLHNAYEGTGIGLVICKKIVEAHGGKIIAKSKVNQGSEFIVTLPAYGEK